MKTIKQQIQKVERKIDQLKPFYKASMNPKNDLHETISFDQILEKSDEYKRQNIVLKHLYFMKGELEIFEMYRMSNYVNDYYKKF